MNNLSQKDLSIIIVAWNVRIFLKNCLTSIVQTIKDINYEIIVIDNNSSDGTFQMVESEFPEVNLVKNKINAGFAAACNQGLSQAKGKYLLLLNPDTVLLENSVKLAREEMENKPEIGVLGARILNPDLSLQASCRRFPDLFSQVLIMLKLHHIFPNNPHLKKYLMSDWPHNESRPVDQVMGAFFLTKREIVEKVGSFDEKYKFWFEEVDFCRRVTKAGYQVYYLNTAKVIHHKGESFKQTKNLRKQMYYNNSMIHYFKKNHNIFAEYLVVLLTPLSLLIAFLIQLFPGLNNSFRKTKI